MESTVLKQLEEKLPCNVFIYIFEEAELQKRFYNFKALGVQVLSRFADPELWGEFRDEFIETNNQSCPFTFRC